MLTPPPVYEKIERFLEPMQPVVVGMILATMAVSVWMIYQKNPVLRTLWVVYLLSP